jgi:UDP-N-acetylglucosamine diphosphorylase/glucosamine-1-phosphate N-acetyltransferase
MRKKLFFFEDDSFNNFFPLTYNRPVYLLLCGIKTLREKLSCFFPDAEKVLLCRDYLSELLKGKTMFPVNDFELEPDDEVLFLNGRILTDQNFSNKIHFRKEPTLFQSDNKVAGISCKGSFVLEHKNFFENLYKSSELVELRKKMKTEELKLKMANYLWDLVNWNGEEIINDFESLRPSLNFKKMFNQNEVDAQCIIYNLSDVWIGEKVKIDAFVVLDARKGPIFIDDEAEIQSHTRIEGPCFIGKKTIITGGKIRENCSFGPNCRVGEEVEESIFLGYSNKYHEGFLGHSYIGEWVNLGAMTTNSDLKNNYGPVSVILNDQTINSGLTKVGSFIGDHSKTGIGTLLNTGTVIGFSSNVFGGGMPKEKYIPSFAWGSEEGFQEYKLDKAVEVAGKVKERRGEKLSEAEKEVFTKLFEMTKEERKTF